MSEERLPSLLSGLSSGEYSISKTFPATIEEFPNVIAFFEETLTEYGASFKVITQMNIIAEELFTNVAKFAYKDSTGYCQIDIEKLDGSIKVRFIDNGGMFNPLEKEDPDISTGADEREIGGLGILMVKKMSDQIEYSYQSNCNILTLVKNL